MRKFFLSALFVILLTSNCFGTQDFSGSDALIRISSTSGVRATNITVGCWANASGVAQTEEAMIFGAQQSGFINSNWQLRLGSSSLADPQFLIFIGSGLNSASWSPKTLNSDQWYLIVGTYDGSNIRIYVDGVDRGSTAETGTINTTTVDLTIANLSDGSQDFKGEISECAVWNTALSADEILSWYNAKVKRFALQISPSNLKGYWVLDSVGDGVSGDTKTFYDLTGFSDGTGEGGYTVSWSHSAGSQNRLIMYNALWENDGIISHDNTEENNCNAPDGTGCTLSAMTINNGSGNKRLVVCGVTTEGNTNLSTLAFDGTNMTKIGELDEGFGTAGLFYMLDADLPATSGDYDVVLTTSSSVNDRNIICTSETNVKQQAHTTSNNNSCTSCSSLSKLIQGTSDYWVFSVIHTGGTTSGNFTTGGSGQTERAEIKDGASSGAAISASEGTSFNLVGKAEETLTYP